ncbi:MAG: ferritin family protein [Candidatus Micrarchaeia archaeon]
MQIKLFRCNVCAKAYLGEAPPSACPFCGASTKYIVPQEEHEYTLSAEDVSDKTKQNITTAIEIEVSNAEFYHCAKKRGKSNYGKKLFGSLAYAEAEHAALLSKVLNGEKPKISLDAGKCSEEYKDNLQEAHNREQNAIENYAKFAHEATEPKVKMIFNALVEIEQSHLKIEEEQLKKQT